MAAEGLSNREIGQQLYISYKTVGYHLNRMFPKLGITSRSQLHAAVSLTTVGESSMLPAGIGAEQESPWSLLRLGHAAGRPENVGVEQRAAHVGDVDDAH